MANDAYEDSLDANGLRFRALRWNGAAPAAFFVHATSFCADGWRPAIEEVQRSAETPLRVVAIDQRGHGGGDVPADHAADQWTRLAADVAAIARFLEERT